MFYCARASGNPSGSTSARRTRRRRADRHHEPARAPQRSLAVDDGGSFGGVGRGQREPGHTRCDPDRSRRLLLRRRRSPGDDRPASRRRIRRATGRHGQRDLRRRDQTAPQGFPARQAVDRSRRRTSRRRGDRDPAGHRHPHRRRERPVRRVRGQVESLSAGRFGRPAPPADPLHGCRRSPAHRQARVRARSEGAGPDRRGRPRWQGARACTRRRRA